MKILHLSDGVLPDWRVEKSAITSINRGDQVAFAGRESGKYIGSTFSKIYKVDWNSRARIGIPIYWTAIRKQVEKVVKEVRPDIVHAHNLFSAKMISEFDLPFIYDDHEYWSKYSQVMTESQKWQGNLAKNLPRMLRRAPINSYRTRLWTKWEKEMVSSRPTITVSDEIAKELRSIGNNEHIFVVPNFPMASETKSSGTPSYHSNLSSVYAGSEGPGNYFQPHRNIDGLVNLFERRDIGSLMMIGWEGKQSGKIRYTGFLARQEMYDEMFKSSVGLLPWKKHWSHKYVNPNKPYEYAHAGLFVLCTSSFKVIQETLKGHCMAFEDYDELALQLERFKEDPEGLHKKRLGIYDFAQNNLLWENYEQNILRAYQLC